MSLPDCDWRALLLPVVILGCSSEAASGGATASGGTGGGAQGDGAGGVAASDGGLSPDADAAVVETAPPPGCEPGTRDGPAEGGTGYTGAGIDYLVRTPASYDATIAHPLIVVYSPAGVTQPTDTEGFTGLTPDETARGYVVTYVNHVTPDVNDTEIGTVASDVAARWCIDEHRVYVTGHSDGGSITTILAIQGMVPTPAAIAPSAAGVQASPDIPCPAPPLPVMVLHSSNDALFTGFGFGMADWWSECFACAAASPALPDGCVPHGGCADGVEVQYCEGNAAHGVWPQHNADMLDFFDRFAP